MTYAPPYGEPYARPPYEHPPYSPPYGQAPYALGPYNSPPPFARPPPGPPPPLPAGWVQEWEPNARRAFWFEVATGRSQWEPPYSAPGYPPEPCYGPPLGSPPGVYEERGEYHEQREKKHSNVGKYLAAGAAGLAVGGIAGAVIEHERDEYKEESEREEREEEREEEYEREEEEDDREERFEEEYDDDY